MPAGKGCRKLIPETGLAACGDVCAIVTIYVSLAVGILVCAYVHAHYSTIMTGIFFTRGKDRPWFWEEL